MVAVGSYLFATIVLVADIDLTCERAFPLNYIVYLAQAACMSYITCYVAISLYPYLIFSMLLTLLIVTIVWAAYGAIDWECGREDGSCMKS